MATHNKHARAHGCQEHNSLKGGIAGEDDHVVLLDACAGTHARRMVTRALTRLAAPAARRRFTLSTGKN